MARIEISSSWYEAWEKNVQAIKTKPKPKNLEVLQSFMRQKTKRTSIYRKLQVCAPYQANTKNK